MKNFIFLAAFATCAIAASCNKNSTPELIGDDDNEKEIIFETKGVTASVDVKSVTAVESLTEFNVAATIGTDSEKYAWESSYSVLFAKQNEGNDFAGGRFWPKDDPKFHFYASNVALTCTDGKTPTVAAENTTDIVCAYLATPSFKSSNTLTFKHVLARLGTVTITAPDNGYSFKSVSVSITPIKSGTYDIKTGNGKNDGTGWSNTTEGEALQIASAQGENAASDTYLVPGTYTLTAIYTLKKDLYEEQFKKTGHVNIQGGKINNISATLPLPDDGQGAVDIIFSISVSPWESANVSATF